MFTLISQKRNILVPRAFYLHAANAGSAVLTANRNVLDESFRDAIIPEDQIIEDAAVRTLMAKNVSNDIEMTRLFTEFQWLRGNAGNTNPPAAGTRGNMDEVQNRITQSNVSLPTLLSAYNELRETGWTWAEMDAFWASLNDAYEKMPWLKEIKEAYMGLDIAINRFNNVADAHEQITVLSPKEVEAFNDELVAVSWKDIEATLAELGNMEETVLEGKLSEIKRMAKYRSLRDQAGFDRNFLSYFSQRLLRWASRNLEVTKEKVFQDRRGEFEGTLNQARKAAQEFIISLDPGVPDQLQQLHQIFVTNRRYFEITGRRVNGSNLDWDTAMSTRVRAIMDRYYPDMIREYERPEVVSRVPGMSSPARTTDHLVRAVLDQSTAENQLYYTSESPMRRPEELTTVQSSVKTLGKAWEVLWSFFRSPTTQKWVQGFMKTGKKAVETTVGFAGKMVGKSADIIWNTVIANTTGYIDGKMKGADSWAWKKREAWFLNTLGWMGRLPARPLTKVGRLLTWGSDSVIGKWVGNIAISKGVNTILTGGKNAYKATNDVIATLPDSEIEDVFTGFGWLFRNAWVWTGKWVEWMGKYSYDRSKVGEMRSILTSLRRGLDESGYAGIQATHFRSVMGRTWGTGTARKPIAPVTVAPPAAANP